MKKEFQSTCLRIVRTSMLMTSVLLVAACGGGGGDGGGSPPVSNAAVGGLWGGVIAISGQGTLEMYGIVAEDGRAYFLQEDGVMYWGTVSSSGNQITSTLTGAGLFGLLLWDGSASGTGTVSGTIQARASMSGNSTFTTALGGRTTGTIALTYDSLYDQDSSLALIAGNYADAVGLYAGVLNIAGNGDLFLQDPDSGCVINGRIAVINAAYNAYDIRLTYSGCTGTESVLNGVTFQGLAAYDPALGEAIALVHGSVGGTPYPTAFVFDRV